MTTMVLGHRMSFRPILGQADPIQFAGLAKESRWPRLPGQLGNRPGGTYKVAEPTPRTQEAVTLPVPKKETAPLPAEEPPVRGKREPSTVYSRAQYSRKPLSDEQKAAVDEYVGEHQKKMRTRHINPLAVALEIDAPASRIAHYLETHHKVPTLPGKGGQDGMDKMLLQGGDFNAWADDYARRLRDHDSGVHFFPEDEDLEAQSRLHKAQEAEKLANYAQAGVITPEAARGGATAHLSLAPPPGGYPVVRATLAGWDYTPVSS